MTNWEEKWRKEQEAETARGKAYFLEMQPILKAAHVSKVVVSYDGQGDDGSFQGVTFVDANVKLKLDEQEIENAASNVLSGQGIDWYNNEGGFGDVVFNVITGKITIEHNYRIETSKHKQFKVE